MQQLAPCRFEPDVVQRLERCLAKEGAELPLQRAAGKAGGGRELGNADVALRGRLHEVERTPHAARQHGSGFSFLVSLGRHSSPQGALSDSL
jgi:hypothetical protein